MSPSPDLVVNIVFGLIMIVIGISAIWIVRWQTYFLLFHQSKLTLQSPGSIFRHLLTTILLAGHTVDEERALHVNEPTLVNSRCGSTVHADTSASQDEYMAEPPACSLTTSAKSSAIACVTRSDTDTTVASASTSDTTACTTKGK
jgi:hypothetical protein